MEGLGAEGEYGVYGLILILPTTSNKLLAEWQGPYTIVQKNGQVNYV